MNATTVSRRGFLGGGASLLGTAAAVRQPSAAKEAGVAPIAFAHIAVRARDLAAALDWYAKVLGTRVSLHTGRGAFATYDEEHHRISFFSRPRMGALPADLGGFERMAFGYDSIEDLAHAYRRLQANGILPRRAAAYGPITALYYRDPTGLNIELSVAAPVTDEELYEHCADGCLIDGARTREIDPNRLPLRGAAPAADAPPLKPTAPLHTVLKTERFEAMIDWYRTVFPARIRFRSDRVCFLSCTADRKLLAIVRQEKTTAPGPTYGFDHYAFEYATMRDLAVNVYARLKEQGILPYWTTNHGMTTSFYYADPDINRIELQVDNFRTKKECLDYIRGPDFARNFIGIDVNPDDLVAMVEDGASYEEMHRRVEAPRTTPVPSPYR